MHNLCLDYWIGNIISYLFDTIRWKDTGYIHEDFKASSAENIILNQKETRDIVLLAEQLSWNHC